MRYMMDPSKLFDWYHKLSPRYLLSLCVFLGLLLLAVWRFPDVLGMSVATALRPYVVIGFVATCAFLVGGWFAPDDDWFRNRWSQRLHSKMRRGHLHRLTPDEKVMLRRYIDEQMTTQHVPGYDGVAHGLERSHIVYQASEEGVLGKNYPFNLEDEARAYLTAHPDLLI
jgi:hypothetical protein